MDEITRLTAEDLSADAFSPFGRVIEQPDRSPDARGPGWSWWGETLLLPSDGRPFGVGLLDLRPAPTTFDWAERHMRTVEAILAVEGGCLVYVGPRDLDDPVQRRALGRFRVFRVPQGCGVVLEPGVWHGAPLVAERPSKAVVLLLEGTGRDDTQVVRFIDTPVAVEP